MKRINPGDKVVIIDVSHSGAAGNMPRMIGQRYIVDQYFDDIGDKLVIEGWIFDIRDVRFSADVKIPEGGVFNINNIYKD